MRIDIKETVWNKEEEGGGSGGSGEKKWMEKEFTEVRERKIKS